MSAHGPIIVVDDDNDDQILVRKAIEESGIENRCIFFDKSHDAWIYLKETTDKPLVIISDINLPEQSGIEFKRQVDEDPYLRLKSIPFVFLSTSGDRELVNKAFKDMTVQGFFQKPSSFHELKVMLRRIVEYWVTSKHPNSF
jgi:CheY-like chemotaxis protein